MDRIQHGPDAPNFAPMGSLAGTDALPGGVPDASENERLWVTIAPYQDAGMRDDRGPMHSVLN